MSGTPVIERLSQHRLLPVVVASGEPEGLGTADALESGGLPVAEFTFRVPGAADALAAVRAKRPDILAGAGTIINVDQVDQAVAAGAQYLVSPGISDDVVRRATSHGIPIVPGVATPTDIMRALDLGIDTVKLFPAAALGGLSTLAALAAPFPDVTFVPTGGIGPTNAADYLAHRSVIAVGGSWMVQRSAISHGDWNAITEATQEAVAAIAALTRK
ncbi:bifunctional 4-hydroxy-2-oxoglutarate aldolase/2-dehydro-3-deoxy-phosphogluconate aldolase [Demequina sp. B12]|uniref:bifunctional 4-hydroxy-2-oxoglutarate aldolase/2-dehydro-3-deoxy-phosphogluconate aldolase n=1 Tax=Demequina sp. B12 TaxID=2992757 RepID=UPI00237A0D45|nr:bifunctional 4-hydroxy-2-oxoglutarate aldolase/2-dehydro-3-deoxy-phosphogluconate aldolase [Demequina sp. B12]MDE0572908.1 bifunctional 4-hydroxy-2-oxoglutarate aldolase/2-dehydro-3-deoxy-phosphogluconate aldolase [Demequina sp. B12]